MIKAVLFDLDNTLLRNPTQAFVSGYIERVNQFFGSRWNIEPGEQLRQGVQLMMNGPRGIRQSNLAMYWDCIHPLWPHTTEELLAAFDEFYATEYETLKAITEPSPYAAEVIDRVRGAGYKVIIATNPVYPLEAIRRRLVWAGLPGNLSHYDFVTTADNMHFTKPHPAYYAEILARAGLEPDEAIMVGDEPQYDIAAARTVGLHTYHLTWETLGTLLDEIPKFAELLPYPVEAHSIVPQWQGNLGALFGTIDDMPAHFWEQHPFAGEWSPLEIVCHLRDFEAVVERPRLERIAVEDNPFIIEPSPPPAPREMSGCGSNGNTLAEEYLQERLKTIAFVEGLADNQWTRPARHSVFGPTTLLEMAYFTAQHDRLHLRQLCQTIGGCE